MGHRVITKSHQEFGISATLDCDVMGDHEVCVVSDGFDAQMIVSIAKLKTYARAVTVRGELRDSTCLEFKAPGTLLTDRHAWEETQIIAHSDVVEYAQYDKVWLLRDKTVSVRPAEYRETITVRVFYTDQWAPHVKLEIAGVTLPVIADTSND